PTVTATRTASSSPTSTASLTATGTPTNSATRTSTATATDTLINSATPTYTPTLTATPTASNSPTSTASLTPTATFMNSATRTPTATATDTLINTGTPTATATATPTLTRTVTPTSSPTPVTVSVSQGTNPPGNSTQIQGAAGVPIQQVQMNNPGNNAVTLNSITVSETGAPPAGITSVSLLKNGVVIATAAFSGSTATFNFNDVVAGNNGAVTYEITANFSSAASTGAYQFGVSGAVGSNGQPALFSGLPLSGSSVTIVSATATFTPTPTVTSTLTPLPTATATKTSTPSGKPTVVVYPNPSTGGTVQLNPGLTSASNVSIEIFTVAFRKVAVLNDANVQPGAVLPVPLVDKTGTPLASGLYYLVVQTNQGRTIVKLLILR
ncbi:MAG TPA: T9SS type A sorting domain-containing protein, partial [bacterium]|nr:T9SS type A sorting domain-containing protein [bacterium]